MESNKTTHGKLLFKKHVQNLLNLNIQTIRRMWNRGEFPKPIMINGRCAWRSDVIKEWLDNLEITHINNFMQDE